MKKFNKILDIINYLWIIIIMLYIFGGSLSILFFKFKFTKYANVFYIINIITLLLCIINYIIKRKFKLVDLLILILIIVTIVTTYLSDYREVSLWGTKTRCEGMIMIICYYLLYVLSSFIKDNNKKYVIGFMLALGVVQAFIGVLQQEKIIKGYTKIYVNGLAGNSNFYSTQALLWLSLSLGLFIFSNKWIYLPLVFIFAVSLSLGGAMSCFVGLICVLLSILFIIIYNKKYINTKSSVIRYITSIILIAITFVLVGVSTNNKFVLDIKKLFFESNEVIVNQNVSDNFGSGRMEIWKKTLPKVKDYLWLGVGIDCYKYIFNPLFKNKNGVVTKAHNEYLQYIITEGIYCLIAYLLLLLFSIKNNFKRSRNESYHYLDYAILLSVIGYITQAFFNISVIRVAPLFYILLGLCYKRETH